MRPTKITTPKENASRCNRSLRQSHRHVCMYVCTLLSSHICQAQKLASRAAETNLPIYLIGYLIRVPGWHPDTFGYPLGNTWVHLDGTRQVAGVIIRKQNLRLRILRVPVVHFSLSKHAIVRYSIKLANENSLQLHIYNHWKSISGSWVGKNYPGSKLPGARWVPNGSPTGYCNCTSSYGYQFNRTYHRVTKHSVCDGL